MQRGACIFFLSLVLFIWSRPAAGAEDARSFPHTGVEALYIPETDYWTPPRRGGAESTLPDDPLCGWRRILTPIAGYFLDVHFVDSVRGWAGHTDNGCIRTTDAGQSWEVTTFNDTNFVTSYEGVYFANKDTGWAVGGAIQIRKTTNGGVTWFKQHGPPVLGINRSVFFLDTKIGYVVGSQNFPYEPFAMKTTDGGSTWAELDVSFPGAQELIDQYWFNADTGWICGYNVLLYTTDGGATFTDMFGGIPPTGNGYNILLGITFADEETGWIGAGNLERHNIYKTSNGGLEWFFQDNPVSQQGLNQINDVHFMSADTGWAAHGTPGTGAIMITTNGGEEWIIENHRRNWYDCFSRYRDVNIWCGGSEGSMWYRPIALLTEVPTAGDPTPSVFRLKQNYPNPFNPETTITFSISEPEFVTLRIYDLLGREVSTLVAGHMNPGLHSAEWDGTDGAGLTVASGIYLYRLTAGSLTETRMMQLLK